MSIPCPKLEGSGDWRYVLWGIEPRLVVYTLTCYLSLALDNGIKILLDSTLGQFLLNLFEHKNLELVFEIEYRNLTFNSEY